MTDGKFNADFLRPINVHANEGQFFVDATDDGYTVNVLDLVYLTDWRDYKFAKGYKRKRYRIRWYWLLCLL